ncbi:MAG: ATPase [Anaerolineae bacterium SM23_ 63]|nr:MAG: ATPase [Anaerolineae bacterium SM23_ 63]HEY46120.1 ATPase [Anaerolineae bacterium]
MTEDIMFAGIDIGATTTKVVVIDDNKTVLGRFVVRSGTDLISAATEALDQAVAQADISRDSIQAIVATGYGRKNVPFVQDTKTEISCHGRGCYHYFPEAITVVDIGGQDSKIIKLDAQGKRTGFKMNRKCAAGTGAFLEEIAHKMDIPLGDLNRLAHGADTTAKIGSYCTVFTATEILDRIRAGERMDGIIRGLFDSVAKRIVEMDTLTNRVIMTGGVVAFNDIVAELLSIRTGVEVEIAPHPQEMGAFGAALFASDFSSQ